MAKPTDNAANVKAYAEKRKAEGAVSVKLWLDADVAQLLEKHRGDTPRAAFIREYLSLVLNWKDDNAGQMDLLAYLASADSNDNKEERTEKGT